MRVGGEWQTGAGRVWPRQVVQGLSVSGVKILRHINFFNVLFLKLKYS